jgi:hypothetical protein
MMRGVIHITDTHYYPKNLGEIQVFKHRLENVFKNYINYFLIPLKPKALNIAIKDKRIVIIRPNKFLPDIKPKKSVKFGKLNLVHYLK